VSKSCEVPSCDGPQYKPPTYREDIPQTGCYTCS
jgi:hypothetical protein